MAQRTLPIFWIYPIMIMQNNSIYSSHFKLFCRNWVSRKFPTFPGHVDVFMWHIFYALDVIIVVCKNLKFIAFRCSFFIYSMKK